MEASRKEIFKGQLFHLFLLYFLLAGIFQLVSRVDGFLDGSLWGVRTKWWFFLGILIPILHQYYVWFCWRFELHLQLLTKSFGESAFPLYKFFFTLLIIARPITAVLLAISNGYTLPIPHMLGYIMAVMFAIPAIYLMYSIRKYFGFDRAYGIDHFKPQEARSWPLVNQGIFKYTNNGMYVFGFLMLYVPAFIWMSKAALVLAVFNHAYIWVHYYFTERPDMQLIYGSQD